MKIWVKVTECGPQVEAAFFFFSLFSAQRKRPSFVLVAHLHYHRPCQFLSVCR